MRSHASAGSQVNCDDFPCFKFLTSENYCYMASVNEFETRYFCHAPFLTKIPLKLLTIIKRHDQLRKAGSLLASFPSSLLLSFQPHFFPSPCCPHHLLPLLCFPLFCFPLSYTSPVLFLISPPHRHLAYYANVMKTC